MFKQDIFNLEIDEDRLIPESVLRLGNALGNIKGKYEGLLNIVASVLEVNTVIPSENDTNSVKIESKNKVLGEVLMSIIQHETTGIKYILVDGSREVTFYDKYALAGHLLYLFECRKLNSDGIDDGGDVISPININIVSVELD